MQSVLSRSWTFWLTAASIVVLGVTTPGAAQQPPATPAPVAQPAPAAPAPTAAAPAAQPTTPPPWAQGRPDSASVADIAPVAPPPIATAVDKLPLDKLKLPNNFHIEVYAPGIANARSLRVGDAGTVFVSTRLLGKVHAVTDKNGKREVKTLATDMNSPNGIALHDGM